MSIKMVKLPIETHTKLKAQAEQKGMPMSAYISHLLELSELRSYIDYRLSGISTEKKTKSTPKSKKTGLDFMDEHYEKDIDFNLTVPHDGGMRTFMFSVVMDEESIAFIKSEDGFPYTHDVSIEKIENSKEFKSWCK